ncbi:MAG: zonular occludens toxin domain-containing protein [Burkholderiaceae bacterium]|nr:zonular occludens toxin domain-containing protein [Burkholderiaceae bacterium]
MIYLITGNPGSGKTLYTVAKLIPDLLKEKPAELDARRLVVDGIPELAYDKHLMAPCKPDDKGLLTCEDGQGLNTWHDWCKPGDLLVVDEVQRYWRPRSMGAKVPDYVANLETHRHKGVDFVLITQNPMLLDQNVRRLVGRHIHVRRVFGGGRSLLYDWDGCQADTTRVQGATKSLWSYPKSAFSLYKSSEMHIKQKQKIPVFVVVPILAIVGGIALAPTLFSSMSKAVKPDQTQAPKTAPSSPAGSLPKDSPLPPPAVPSVAPPAPALPDFTPRISGQPETAPAYDEVRKVINLPRIAGGACTSTRCVCVTQQGTSAGLTDDQCRTWIVSPPFDPYTVAAAPAPAPAPATATAPALQSPPLNSGVINPLAESRPPQILPPSSPAHPTLPPGITPGMARKTT